MNPLDYALIPAYTMEALRRWVKQSIEPGGFLMAVLSNDLKEATGRADSYNMPAIAAIVSYLYNECPATCWGSPERVAAWAKARKAPHG